MLRSHIVKQLIRVNPLCAVTTCTLKFCTGSQHHEAKMFSVIVMANSPGTGKPAHPKDNATMIHMTAIYNISATRWHPVQGLPLNFC